jgi:hypothetical protein
MDQLTTLRPGSLEDVQKVLFFRKMPTYIRDAVNPKDCPTLANLTDHCNEVLEHHNNDGGATIAAEPPSGCTPLPSATAAAPHPTGRDARPNPARQPPFRAQPGATGRLQLVFQPHPLPRSRLQVQHRLLISGKRVGRRWPPTLPPPAPLSPAHPPSPHP